MQRDQNKSSLLDRLSPVASQLAGVFADDAQSSYDVTELDGLVPHHNGRETAAALAELGQCRLIEIRRGVSTSSRNVAQELRHIDRVEVLPGLRALLADRGDTRSRPD